ncbi:MAG: hypothetical protein ACT6R2_09640, partial [Blastomonas fulva]|uniref:hypothetical protein n=1 Tax=Blastomonas fulva TaxID=1550728 RepID=UPI004033B6CD
AGVKRPIADALAGDVIAIKSRISSDNGSQLRGLGRLRGGQIVPPCSIAVILKPLRYGAGVGRDEACDQPKLHIAMIEPVDQQTLKACRSL